MLLVSTALITLRQLHLRQQGVIKVSELPDRSSSSVFYSNTMSGFQVPNLNTKGFLVADAFFAFTGYGTSTLSVSPFASFLTLRVG